MLAPVTAMIETVLAAEVHVAASVREIRTEIRIFSETTTTAAATVVQIMVVEITVVIITVVVVTVVGIVTVVGSMVVEMMVVDTTETGSKDSLSVRFAKAGMHRVGVRM